MTKEHLKILLIDLAFLLLTLLMLGQPTVEYVVGLLLTTWGVARLVLGFVYFVNTKLWLEVHKAKEKAKVTENNIATVDSLAVLPDLHDLVGGRTLKTTIFMCGTLIIAGILFITHLYSGFVLTIGRWAVDSYMAFFKKG